MIAQLFLRDLFVERNQVPLLFKNFNDLSFRRISTLLYLLIHAMLSAHDTKKYIGKDQKIIAKDFIFQSENPYKKIETL